MTARAALALSTALLCLVLGWVFAPATFVDTAPAHPLRLAALRLEPAGPGAAETAAALAGAAPAIVRPAPAERGPAPPRAVPSSPPAPPRPPQADAVLRTSVAAVTDEGGVLGLVLAGGGGRRLHAGDRFMGWTLASVTRSGAVMTKGGERREVSFFSPLSSSLSGATGGGSLVPAGPPTRRSAAPPPRAPSAEEFFRGFRS